MIGGGSCLERREEGISPCLLSRDITGVLA